MFRLRALIGVPLAALLLLLPALGQSTEERRLALSLERLRIEDDKVVAPIASGGEARLSLDPALERAALKLLGSAEPLQGGIVAIDAQSGKVLVFAEVSRDGKRRPVLTTAAMPAASVFKLVTTAALFENTELKPSDEVCVSGGAHAIERRHLDAPRGAKIECAPFRSALGFSKNAVFAQLATHRLLRADLISTARALGFNAEVPSDVKAPVGTLVVPFNDLEFARTAAGFVGSTLSPLGAAHLANVIAHGGESTKIRIVDSSADYVASPELEVVGRALRPLTAQRIRRMMEVTVHSGTSRRAFVDDSGRSYLGDMRVAGKTGTLRPNSEAGLTSWFIGFAPSRDPELVVSVMLKNSKVWRRKANELARDLFRVYFHARGRPGISDPLPEESAPRVSALSP